MKLKVKRIYPLSPMQKGMLFHNVINKNSTSYFEQVIFDIKGYIDIEVFQKAYNILIERYDILRTIFSYNKFDEPMQVVIKNRDGKIYFKNLENISAEEKEVAFEVIKSKDKAKGFDTTKDLLIRSIILKLDRNKYKFIFSFHHILMDGWCVSIILNELITIYNSIKSNKINELIDPVQYENYIQWLQCQDKNEGKEYWEDYLKGYEEKIIIPTTKKVESTKEQFKEKIFTIDTGSTEKLKNISERYNVTLNIIVQAVWGILLQKYNNTNDIVFGAVVSGRNIELRDIESMVGLFINTIPIRVKSEHDTKFIDLVNKLQMDSFKGSNYHYCDLAEIQSKSLLKQNLISSLMIFENYYIQDNLNGINDNNDFEITNYEIEEHTNYNFNIIILPGNNLRVKLSFNENMYDDEFVEYIYTHFMTVINQVVINEDILVSQIETVSNKEKEILISKFNYTKNDYDFNKTIQQMIEEQVEKTPDRIAISFKNESITYRELNKRSNQLARVIIERNIKNDNIVAIMMNRSIEMIIGILGVLKSGAAYLPIDMKHPKERVDYMLNNSGAVAIISDQNQMGINYKGHIINILDNYIRYKEETNGTQSSKSNNLAYVIYTSGTTGCPKGVMVEHRNVNNFINGIVNDIRINEYSNILCITTIGFDIFGLETLVPLTNGMKVVITEDDMDITPDSINEVIVNNKIEVIQSTPSRLKMLMQNKYFREYLYQLKVLLIGGEAMTSDLLLMLKDYKDLKVYNMYGPTETTIWSTVKRIDSEEFITIGKPIQNTKVFILNKDMKLQPIGVVGELCIGGDGVSRGYLNNDQLTSEKFVSNPYQKDTIIYKTGDLARWLPDGNIQCLGRVDEQVKIRGYRIELGDIENSLLRIKGISKVAVIVNEDNNDKNLYAYYVGDIEYTVEELRMKLSNYIPMYMIPSYFIRVDEITLNSNGKIDKSCLVNKRIDLKRKSNYEVFTNELEKNLVTIWNEVLGIEKIGINDSFFELGGHSLKAMTLIFKIHKELNKEVPLKQLFKSPTIKGLSKFIQESEESAYSKIEKVEEREYYGVSSAQKRMYIIQCLDKESIAYNMPQVFEIEESINKSKMEDTFKKLVERHEALRTYFETVEDEIVQKIDKNYEFKLKEQVSHKSTEEIASEFIKPFNLGKAPLIRAKVVDAQDKTYLLIDMHHIISDGVSMSILINEFATLYNGVDLEPLKLQYKDFASWQNNLLKSEEMKKQEEYWINMFNDEIPVLNMPIDYERPAVQSFEGDSVSFEVGKNVVFKLKELTTKTETTMHMVLLSAFNILLAKYSGQEDVVVGIPIAGRYHADLQNIIGMFVNTLALRNKPEGTKMYLDFLNEVKENSLKAYENQSYQLETLIEKLDIVRDTSRNSLFDVMFNMVDTVSDFDIKLNDMSLIPYGSESSVAKFDLTLNAMEQNGEINISIGYCSKLFNKNSIERLGKHYLAILDIITTNTEVKLGEIQLLSNEEKNLILNKFNDTKMDYQSDKTIQDLFEAQVEKTPDNIAITFEDKKLTYRELNEKANSLAKFLRTKRIKEDSIVGIMIDRSLEMVTGIMGILKAGGAYLPIDPTLPKERIDYILKDSGTEILLSKSDFIEGIGFDGIVIDLFEDTLFNEYIDNLEAINDSNSLAYVIYTSGTTGNPKGVMVEHRSLNNLILGLNKKIYGKYNKYLNVCLVAPYYFDASVKQIFAAILNGHSLYITDDYTRRDSRRLIQYYEENNIDISDGTPIHLKMMASSEFLRTSNVEVKEYIIGGEELPLNTVKDFYSNLRVENKSVINNVYGPTECCVDSSIYTINYELIDEMKFVPIGEPMINYKLYILDIYNKLVPIGVTGELYISGEGIARGYLNNSQLTERKFIDNPFEIGTKMYKTGDLARWLPDGNIEYLGRIDNQVKIRGFRIELGEIESRILQHEDVKEATVIVIDGKDNDKHICSYIVSDKEVSELNLRDYLKESLPEYMIPSYFVSLDKMPITSNGKLDRRALPKPNLDERLIKYEVSRNDLEETLVKIWSEVLGIDKIGINDNFFELGGHSLKAMTLISKIHKETNKEVPLKELFKSPTIKGLSKFIEEAKDNIFYNIAKLEDKPYYETSSAQKRMYIIQGINKESIAYNMPQIFEIEGIKDKKKIEETLKKLISRHEALRTYFETIEGEIVQKIDVDYEFRLKERLETKTIEEIENDFIKPFDLGKAPLFRAEIVEIHEKIYLLLDMHHIISDGVSMSILMGEFGRLYNGQELQPLSIQYKDFAAWQNDFLKTEAVKSQEEYWINIFKDNTPVLELPYDYERTSIKSLDGGSIEFEIDSVVTKKLKQFAIKTETTMHMVVLSAFTILLYKYSGQEDIIIGVPISGRRHSDVQNIMGIFINTLVLRNKPKGDKKFIEFLTEVKENSLKAYDNQDYQLETLIQKLNIVREQSRNPLFDVTFNTLNIEGETVKLDEITLRPILNENKTAKFDLNLSLVEGIDNLQLTFIYCKDLFNKESIEIMRDDFIEVLNKISQNDNMLLQNMCKSEIDCKKNIQMNDEFCF